MQAAPPISRYQTCFPKIKALGPPNCSLRDVLAAVAPATIFGPTASTLDRASSAANHQLPQICVADSTAATEQMLIHARSLECLAPAVFFEINRVPDYVGVDPLLQHQVRTLR